MIRYLTINYLISYIIYHYGIQGKIHEWISTWLTQRTQRVDYELSFAQVQSGVPQGTVFGPLMFLLYINDINCRISSKLRLFADDCILYRTINGQNDHFHLQTDLDLIVKWTETWQMNLNINKCAILTCSRLLSSSTSVYTINGQSLTRVTQHPYLGVMFDSIMSFSPHISNITCNAIRILNFVKRNLYKCNRDTKCMAYTSLVRPVLEYTLSVWDPYLNKNILAIEMIQRWAARWVKSDYIWLHQCSVILIGLLFNVVEKYQD